MNVIFNLKGIEYVVTLREAKRILNNVYDKCDQVYINGKKIEVDHRDRHEIMQQLHGEIYV